MPGLTGALALGSPIGAVIGGVIGVGPGTRAAIVQRSRRADMTSP
jgi:hypothetical protein